MVRALVIASIVWPLLLGAAVWQRANGRASVWTGTVYAACSRICHQKPERSFQSAAVPWPVCARCSGLYLAAPFGAVVAVVSIRRRAAATRQLWWLAAASVPTAWTLAVEWGGFAAPSNLTRALAALPVGATIAFILVRTAAGDPRPIE